MLTVSILCTSTKTVQDVRIFAIVPYSKFTSENILRIISKSSVLSRIQTLGGGIDLAGGGKIGLYRSMQKVVSVLRYMGGGYYGGSREDSPSLTGLDKILSKPDIETAIDK